jgi:DNA-binding response OmpR family regulator
MAASPLPQDVVVVLFGHDPNVIANRCSALVDAGYRCVIATTAQEVEQHLMAGTTDALLVGSQTGPLTRLRLAEKARQNGVAVVHIAYHNHPVPSEDEIYVTRPLGSRELVAAMHRALRHHSR